MVTEFHTSGYYNVKRKRMDIVCLKIIAQIVTEIFVEVNVVMMEE